MAGRIKDITVEIGSDTTKLQTALKGVNSEIRNTQTALKDVEKLLKLALSNKTLLAQEQKLLTDAVSETKDKLNTLKNAAEQAFEQLQKGDISQAQFDALQREIIETEAKFKKSRSTSINSATWSSSRSTLTLTTGVYMISASLYFGTKENGRRGARIITSVDEGATFTALSHSVQMIGASNTSSLIYVNTSAIIGVITESMIIKLQGYQDTGAALNITNSYLRAVRIQ